MEPLDVAVWIASASIAIGFLLAGLGKIIQPQKAGDMTKVHAGRTVGQLRAIGTLETLGAVGLIVPPAMDVLPWLAGAAGLALFLLMAVAATLHSRVKEWKMLPVNASLGLTALFVAAARFGLIG